MLGVSVKGWVAERIRFQAASTVIENRCQLSIRIGVESDGRNADSEMDRSTLAEIDIEVSISCQSDSLAHL